MGAAPDPTMNNFLSLRTISLVGILALSLSCTAPANPPPAPTKAPTPTNALTNLQSYYNTIDTSCRQDSDCVVKDVHNCCGYFPQCVNKSAATDSALVQRICREQGLAGGCGFPAIESCECRNNRCSSVAPAGGERIFLQ